MKGDPNESHIGRNVEIDEKQTGYSFPQRYVDEISATKQFMCPICRDYPLKSQLHWPCAILPANSLNVVKF